MTVFCHTGLFVDRWKKRQKKVGWGKGTSVYDSCIVMGNVEVGGCWIGYNTLLDGTGGGIEIGNHCDISAGVRIYTHVSIERCITESKAIKICGENW